MTDRVLFLLVIYLLSKVERYYIMKTITLFILCNLFKKIYIGELKW